MNTKLSDLGLRNPKLLGELKRRGYETVDEMKHVPTTDALRMKGMGRQIVAKNLRCVRQRPGQDVKLASHCRALPARCQWRRTELDANDPPTDFDWLGLAPTASDTSPCTATRRKIDKEGSPVVCSAGSVASIPRGPCTHLLCRPRIAFRGRFFCQEPFPRAGVFSSSCPACTIGQAQRFTMSHVKSLR